MVHSAVSAFLVGAAAASPITDVWLINAKNANCDEISRGGEATGNLNQDISKGEDIRLCSSGGGGKAITDLKVVKADHNLPGCGSGWSPVQGRDGANGDLNQGHNGKYETLCQRNEDDKPPITDLQVQTDTNCEHGWHLVSSSNGNPNVNEHGHHKGRGVYLCYELGCQVTDIVGYWSPINAASSGDAMEFEEHSDFSQTKVSTKTVTDSITHSNTHVRHYGKHIKTRINTHTSTWSDTVSTTISHGTSLKYRHTFKRNGYAWQWVTDVDTTCGEMRIETGEVVLSESLNQEPCCYPGGASDQDNAAVCRDQDDLLDGTEHGCKVGGGGGGSGRRRRNSGETEDTFQINDEVVVGNATSLVV